MRLLFNFKIKKMREIHEIENHLTDLIGNTGDDELMDTWLEYLTLKKEASDRLSSRIDQNDPIIVGALMGALVGSLFKD